MVIRPFNRESGLRVFCSLNGVFCSLGVFCSRKGVFCSLQLGGKGKHHSGKEKHQTQGILIQSWVYKPGQPLPETSGSPLKIVVFQKESHLPGPIHFQGQAVSFREGIGYINPTIGLMTIPYYMEMMVYTSQAHKC